MKTQKVWLITGAGKGFGLEISKAALAAGDQVVATVRSKPEHLAAALDNHPSLFIVEMDVTNESQVQAAVQQGMAHFDRLDVVVNNAGFGIVGAVEEATDAEARRQFDTNVFGLLNVTRAVLPYLRAQKSGRVLNISSLYGYDPIVGWGVYSATKFAVEGLSKALALELAPLGIHVTAVAPGLFTTEFLSTESYSVAANVIADYQETVGLMRSRSRELDGHQPGDPKKLAQVILQLATAERPPIHLPIGKDSVDKYRSNAASIEKEVEDWLPVVTSTDHDHTMTASATTRP